MSPLITEREHINHALREARDCIDAATNQEAVWGESADYPDVLAAITGAQRSLIETLRRTVDAWRDGGASWQQIGDSLGISKQAAQQKYGRN